MRKMAPVAIHIGMTRYPMWPLAVAPGASPDGGANDGAAPTGKGATPRPEGLVRPRDPAYFLARPPPPLGRSRLSKVTQSD